MLLLVTSACGDDSDPPPPSSNEIFDLYFSGTAFSPHDGQQLMVKVIDLSDGGAVRSDAAQISNGSFSFSWPNLLVAGRSYRLDYFADINSNSECETSDDHVWSVIISSVSNHVSIVETDDRSFSPSACESFPRMDAVKYGLTLNGNGFDPHEGQTVYAAVVRVDQAKTLDVQSLSVKSGAFSLHWDSILEPGKQYRVDYYADVDGDGQCAGGLDHVWRAVIDSFSGPVTLDLKHSFDFTEAACASFPPAERVSLEFEGNGFDPHEGQTVYVSIIDRASGKSVGTDSMMVEGGQFSFSWPNLLMKGHAFSIDYYADINGDGKCMSGTDHVWRVDLASSVMDDVKISETHSFDFEPMACDSF